jgi:hypothetical protein
VFCGKDSRGNEKIFSSMEISMVQIEEKIEGYPEFKRRDFMFSIKNSF